MKCVLTKTEKSLRSFWGISFIAVISVNDPSKFSDCKSFIFSVDRNLANMSAVLYDSKYITAGKFFTPFLAGLYEKLFAHFHRFIWIVFHIFHMLYIGRISINSGKIIWTDWPEKQTTGLQANVFVHGRSPLSVDKKWNCCLIIVYHNCSIADRIL